MQSISQHLARRHTVVRVFGAVSVATLIAASAGCAAQPQPMLAPPPVGTDAPPPPPAPAPPPGVMAPAVPPAPPALGPAPGPAVDAGAASTTQGVVARFLINPDGDVDGFLTRDGVLVRFPPHMSTQLTSMVRSGDTVQVTGWRDAGGTLRAQRIDDARSGRQLEEQPPQPGMPLPRELRGAGLSRLSAQGQVAYVTSAPRGEPDGVILADGTVINLTPPVAQQFPNLVRRGAQVAAVGYGTRNQYGTALQATAFGAPGNVAQLYGRVPPAP